MGKLEPLDDSGRVRVLLEIMGGTVPGPAAGDSGGADLRGVHIDGGFAISPLFLKAIIGFVL
jgi:hypothetical protein